MPSSMFLGNPDAQAPGMTYNLLIRRGKSSPGLKMLLTLGFNSLDIFGVIIIYRIFI